MKIENKIISNLEKKIDELTLFNVKLCTAQKLSPKIKIDENNFYWEFLKELDSCKTISNVKSVHKKYLKIKNATN